jgi:ParB family transcriptional regulator, chromosome partitioning protein
MSKTAHKNKPRLGRGLSSLISVSELPVEREIAEPMPAVRIEDGPPAGLHQSMPGEISIDLISPNPHQPRRIFDEVSLNELAASLKSSGVIQPVIVRKIGASYQLIAGERRWRAAKKAGLRTLPAIIRDVDSLTQAQMALVENIQREDLNPIDRAAGYRALIEQLGLTQAELAGRLGEDRSSIANFLRLLELAEPVRNMVRDGQLSVGHAKLIAGIPDILEQERIAQLVVSQQLSVRNLERLLQSEARPTTKSASAPTTPHIQELEKSFSRQLGMRVQVRPAAKRGRGKIIIHYATLDQFDELSSRFGITPE